MTDRGPLHREVDLGRFVRLCLQARWESESLEAARQMVGQGELDWEALVELADRGRLGPLLYSVLGGQDLVPPAVEGALRAMRHGHALRDRLLREEMVTVLDRLGAHGVDVLLLKGAALAETVYLGAGLRPRGDLDLLVRREDAGPALDVVTDLGYGPVGIEARPGAYLVYENEVMLAKPGIVGFAVEVHWSLFDSPYYQQNLPLDWFWQTAQSIQIGGTPARVLGSEALILHLCGHLVLHHGSDAENRLLWLHDVAEVLVCYRDQIDWAVLLSQTQACDLVLAVQEVLAEVADGWGGPVPGEVRGRLDALRPSAAEAQVVAWRAADERPVAQRFWSDLASMDGWRTRLRYAWIQLFPSAAYMRARYSISRRLLVPLYYPYRWWVGMRSVWRY